MSERSTDSAAQLPLQVLALSRIDRCRDCPRLQSLVAVAAGRPAHRPGPAKKECRQRRCAPLVQREWPAAS